MAFDYPVIEKQSSDLAALERHVGDCREQQHGENYPRMAIVFPVWSDMTSLW